MTEQLKQVLYVEDNLNNRFLMEMVFKLVEGIQLNMADSAEQGMVQIAQIKPDLILMDKNLPMMSGLDAIQKLKMSSEYQHIPVILLTAEYNSEVIKQGMAAGCVAVESKPFEIKVLLKQIIDVIGAGQLK